MSSDTHMGMGSRPSTSHSSRGHDRPSTSQGSRGQGAHAGGGPCATSAPSTSYALPQRNGGVKTSASFTYHKLGYFSPYYFSPLGRSHETTHGLHGGLAGYTSYRQNAQLAPAQRSGPHDSMLGAQRQPPQQRSRVQSAAPLGSTNPRLRRLEQQDVEYIEAHEARGQEAFQAWAQAKDAENARKKAEAQRAKREEFEAFLRKDEQRKKDDAEAALRWAAAKGDQAVTEAIERVMYQRKQQNVALRQKIRSLTAQSRLRERERDFVLVTSPAQLPTRNGFDATLPNLAQFYAGQQAQEQELVHEKSEFVTHNPPI